MTKTFYLKKWIFDYLPEELLKALDMDLTTPTTKGRSSAIKEDNVNDFVFYAREKKFFWKRIGFFQTLKNDGKGLVYTPIEFSFLKNAYKCFAYLLIAHNVKNRETDAILQEKNSAPLWFQLVIFSMENDRRFLHEIKGFDDFMYDFLFNCPEKDGLYQVSGFFKEIELYLKQINSYRDEIKSLGENIRSMEEVSYRFEKRFFSYRYKFNRNYRNDQKDIEFYNHLSENDKKTLVKLVYKDKVFDLKIDQLIEEEGDLDSIFLCYRPYQFCEYIVKTKRFDDFKKWIKSNKKEIKIESCCHMIMPQFRQLYPLIFEGKNIDLKSIDKDDRKLLYNHMKNLICHKYVQEVKFLLEKGIKLNKILIQSALSTCHPYFLQLIENENKEDVQDSFDSLFSENNPSVKYLMKNGFYPSQKGIKWAYAFDVNEAANNLDLINLLPKDIKLDFLKNPIADQHFDLIDEFIEKYGDRLNGTDFEDWGLDKYDKNYKKLCEKFGIEYVESDSPSPSEHSSSDHIRKCSNKCQKSSEKVKMYPFMCCSRCDDKKLCAVCHQRSITYNPVWVCARHKPSLNVCSICHQKATVTSHSRLCIKCKQKYGHNCILCG